VLLDGAKQSTSLPFRHPTTLILKTFFCEFPNYLQWHFLLPPPDYLMSEFVVIIGSLNDFSRSYTVNTPPVFLVQRFRSLITNKGSPLFAKGSMVLHVSPPPRSNRLRYNDRSGTASTLLFLFFFRKERGRPAIPYFPPLSGFFVRASKRKANFLSSSLFIGLLPLIFFLQYRGFPVRSELVPFPLL